MGFLLNAPFLYEDQLGVLSAETGCSLSQAFNTSTSLEFMARLVCRSLGGWGDRVRVGGRWGFREKQRGR